ENFRPGTLERAGFGYEDVKEYNEDIIYTSISGFGQDGPWKDEPGFDLSIQGLSGLMSLTGDPDGPPTKFGTSISDILSGIYAAFGTTMALYHREKTGEGQYVDVGMLDSMVSLLTYQAGRYFATGEVPERMGNFHPTISPYETFKTEDGYINLALGNDSLYEQFCELIDREDLINDERFASNPDRVDHQEEIHEIIEQETVKKTTDQWLEELSEAGIPAGPIQDLEEVFNHPQVLFRDMLEKVEHPEAGEISVTGVPIKMSETPGDVEDPPPKLGEQTEDILREKLGYSSDEIETLRDDDVV
ncbi:MAG: CaiB/BaiF CoA transferase family protein, partial [bacterium]